MALADRITGKPKNFTGWLATLPERHRATIEGWLRDPAVSHVAIAAAVRNDDLDDDFTGYRTTKETISAWRRDNL